MSNSVKYLMALLTAVVAVAATVALVMSFTTDEDTAERIQYHLEQARIREQYGVFSGYNGAVNHMRNAVQLSQSEDANLLYRFMETLYAWAHAPAPNGNPGAFQEYRDVLQTMLNGRMTPDYPEGITLADLYLLAVEFDEPRVRRNNLIALLRHGYSETGDLRIFTRYLDIRYDWRERRGLYDEAGVIFNGSGRVMRNGLWGFADSSGDLWVAPRYLLATNFAGDYAVVHFYEKTCICGDEFCVIELCEYYEKTYFVQLINRNGFRVAMLFEADADGNPVLFSGPVHSIAHLADTFAISKDGETYTAALRDAYPNDFRINTVGSNFEFIGMTWDGLRVIKNSDGWAIDDFRRREGEPDLSTEFIHEGIAVDELGRSAVNGVIFIKQNGQYRLFWYDGELEGQFSEATFDEARPFFEDGGLAAVRRGDKWGLASYFGDVIVDFAFEDARSSSNGLAAVKVDGLWGYITVDRYLRENYEELFAKMVIEPQFLGAKQFVNGVAPVITTENVTDEGEMFWSYIMLWTH